MKKRWMLLAAAFLLCGCGGAKAEYTAEAGTAEPVVKEVTMAVVGDIMVHDYQYEEAYDPATGTYDFMHNFQDVKRYFEGYDFVIGNLELTFGGPDKEYASFPCFNTPDSFLDAVKDAGFNLLTTANNHSMDTGEAGLKRTISQLDAYDIDHVGTYASQEARDTIYTKEVNGINFAFVSATYGTNGIPVPEDYLVNHIDDTLMADITKAQELADVVVVLPHMGNEYETVPNDILWNGQTVCLQPARILCWQAIPMCSSGWNTVRWTMATASMTASSFILWGISFPLRQHLPETLPSSSI